MNCLRSWVFIVSAYKVSGLFSEPENDPQQHYTETLLTLDGLAHCYDFATEE